MWLAAISERLAVFHGCPVEVKKKTTTDTINDLNVLNDDDHNNSFPIAIIQIVGTVANSKVHAIEYT